MDKNKLEVDENNVWCTISHTVNLGNFESYKFEAGYSQTLEGDDPLEMLEDMQESLRLFVVEKAQRVKQGLDAVDEIKIKKKRKF